MEDVVTWRGRRVFLTGDTGFKGSWLALWLTELGAEVTGFALPAEGDPNLFALARVGDIVTHVDGDIRDAAAVDAIVERAAPEIVFHLAAQPLVRRSYDVPVETFATNVMGTVHLLDACRRTTSVKAVVIVTSDKCYENREWIWPYRESDAMGGFDPYSASKGAAELVVAAYRRSFFADRAVGIASVRAGNVIGGGDWASNRLIPDIMRAWQRGDRLRLRSPSAVRPWQHVLDALSGYLAVGARLLAGDHAAADGWNFGPSPDDARPVGWVADEMTRLLAMDGWDADAGDWPHEAHVLQLDCAKARLELGWRPAWPLATALGQVTEWHRRIARGEDARTVTREQIHLYQSALGAPVGR